MNSFFNRLLESMVPAPEDNVTTSTISAQQAQYEERARSARTAKASAKME